MGLAGGARREGRRPRTTSVGQAKTPRFCQRVNGISTIRSLACLALEAGVRGHSPLCVSGGKFCIRMSTTWLAGRQARWQGQFRSQQAAPHVLALAPLVLGCVVCGCGGCVTRLERRQKQMGPDQCPNARSPPFDPSFGLIAVGRLPVVSLSFHTQWLSPLHSYTTTGSKKGAAGWAPARGRSPVRAGVADAWRSRYRSPRHHPSNSPHHYIIIPRQATHAAPRRHTPYTPLPL